MGKRLSYGGVYAGETGIAGLDDTVGKYPLGTGMVLVSTHGCGGGTGTGTHGTVDGLDGWAMVVYRSNVFCRGLRLG